MRMMLAAIVGAIGIAGVGVCGGEPESDMQVQSRWHAEAAKWEAERDDRVLEPCSQEEWLASANRPAELQGILRHKGWTKSEESYAAGGSDYFVLYVDSEFPFRFFPKVLDEAVRKQLLALNGKYVRLYGRWAPLVRLSEDQARQIAKEWEGSQRLVGDDSPPATWGGGLVADCAEEIQSPSPEDSPDTRVCNPGGDADWKNASVRPARVCGVLRVATPAEAQRNPNLQQGLLVRPDGTSIVLRGNQTGYSSLNQKTVEVRGRWARYVRMEPSAINIQWFGPIVERATENEDRPLMGGGIFVESISEVKDPEPSQK